MNKSAFEIKQRYPNARSGWYDIQGREIWCDMETDGGGWMLVARVCTDKQYVTRDQVGNVISPDATASVKFSDDFINQLRSDSEYTGITPWRAHGEHFNVFPDNPDITPVKRLLTQYQYINNAMTEFDATGRAIDHVGATWLHIGYEHPVCMDIKTNEQTIGFGDCYYSGDTYFAWYCDEDSDGGYFSKFRGNSKGTFWVK